MQSFEILDYPDASMETKGCMSKGRLKLTDEEIQFKPLKKSGTLQTVSRQDIDIVNWQRLAGTWGIRIFTNDGKLHRFAGFKDTEREKLAKFFNDTYGKDMLDRELSVKGWNWGTTKFMGNTLSFEVGKNNNLETAFEIPLPSVQHCTTGKNEITLEFQGNEEAAVSLSEIRLHIPPNNDTTNGDEDRVEEFKENVLKEASVLTTSGDVLATIKEISCYSPRGRYDLKFFHNYVHLHGKTFDYKIPVKTMTKLFFLPDQDGYHCYVTVHCDPPIKQGQTRYHHLVLKFKMDEVGQEIELPLSEKEIKEKYGNLLEKNMNMKTHELICKLLSAVTERKLISPGTFKSKSNLESISCSYKAQRGYIYPLEKGMIYVYKPPLYVSYDEIQRVEFERAGGTSRSFDIKVTTKQEITHVFSSIEKDEYSKLSDFLKKDKGVKILTPGGNGKWNGNKGAVDTTIDHYKESLRNDAAGLSSGDNDMSSNDSDFNPDTLEALSAKEEYDSDPETTSSEEESDDYGSGSDAERKREEKRKQKKEKKEAKEKRKSSEDHTEKRRKKKTRLPGQPKKYLTAYFLWMNENRKQMEKDYPKLNQTELSKKAGELWQTLDDKLEWQKKSEEGKKRYEKEMEKWKSEGGTDALRNAKIKSKKSHKPTERSTTSKHSAEKVGSQYQSKEFIDSNEDSSD